EKRKNPTRIAPEIPTPAMTMNGSPQRGVTLASSSVLRRARAAASSSIPTTKAKTAVATISIGHQIPVTDRAAGPLGLTMDESPVQPAVASAAAAVRRTTGVDQRPEPTRPVDTRSNFPLPAGSKPALSG